MKFEERMITQELSPEYIEHAAKLDKEEAEPRIEEAAMRLERSYEVVAQAKENNKFYASDTGYTITVIPKHYAEIEEVKRGVQSMMHWIITGEGDGH